MNQQVSAAVSIAPAGTGLALPAVHNKGVAAMIEVPLILIAYAVVPFIAIQLMVQVDRPHSNADQNAFPQVEIL
ncbi:MAG: hypothetical protein L6Q38_11395 [Nitrospira sp.]|nr:hypothetical protein [Nitrospira sp.]